MPRQILILAAGHLSMAPRVQKEACALMEAGHRVEVSGVWFDPELAERDARLVARTGIRFTPALDFRGGSPRAEAWRLRVRWRGRWARERFRRWRIFSPALLGYGVEELLGVAEKAAADLTIVHSETGLWVAAQLRRRGRRVGVDFEDWFSRDLPEHVRRARPVRVLDELESAVGREAAYVLAPSRAMAHALAAAYRLPSPSVVYNAFPWEERRAMDGRRLDRADSALPSLHWFSQTIGPDRGLELLFSALPLVRHRLHVYLRGACSAPTRRWLNGLIPPGWGGSVTVLPPVGREELLSRIAEHDIGLALESASIPSRDLSVSNKLFHYLQAGLAVIATDTRGQREVLTACGEAGTLLPEATPGALARAIDRYLSTPELLDRARAAARDAAAGLFSWERQKAGLIEVAARAVGN
jgi:glycosyltransferase involved in cell wall biosynthesis